MDDSTNFQHYYKASSQKSLYEERTKQTIPKEAYNHQAIFGKGNVSKEYTHLVSLNNTNNGDVKNEYKNIISSQHTQIPNNSNPINNDMSATTNQFV